jgi:hypothetical protein
LRLLIGHWLPQRHRSLDRLPDRSRPPDRSRTAYHLSASEVAASLDLTVEQVRTRHWRAMDWTWKSGSNLACSAAET